MAITYLLLVVSILILLPCIIFTVLVRVSYQDKAIFKWVRYQKLCLLLESYHALYTAKYHYWIGLLLFVCVLLYLISVLNFSLNPRVDLMAVIFVVAWLFNTLKGSDCKEGLQELATRCHGNCYLLQLGCFFSSHVVQLRFWRGPGRCSLHICHGHFYPLIGDDCLSCLTLHLAL